jgi:multiple sugar transport system substrate-binding protein
MTGLTRRRLCGTLAALPVAACTRAGDAGELTLWAMGNEAASLPELLRRTAAPGMAPVTVQALPWSAAHEKLLTGFAGGSLPAVAQLGNSWIAEFVAIGALAPLPATAQTLLDDQFASVVETCRIDGQVWAVPWYVDTRLQFYRTDLFERAGYASPPLEWDSWREALRRIRARAGGSDYAVLLPLNEFEQLLTLALSSGARLLRDQSGRGAFADPEFKAALAFYKSLFDERLAPMVSAAQIANLWAEFARGMFATFLSGPWTIGDLRTRLPREMQDRWRTAPNPGPGGMGSAAPGGSSLVVFKTGESDAAWSLVARLMSSDAQFALHELTGDLPARKSVWDRAGLASDPIARPFGTQLGRATALPKVPEWERIVTEMQIVAEQMVRGRYTVDAAAREIDRRADRLLEKRRWMLDRGLTQ